MRFPGYIRIFPLLAVVAALSFGVRFGEAVTGFSSNPGTAQAQEEVHDAVPPPINEEQHADKPAAAAAAAEAPKEMKELEHPADAASNAAAKLTEAPATAEAAPAEAEKEEAKEEWKDALDSDLEYSPVQIELFEDLAKRRKEIESKERELAMREALSQAAEKELEQKYGELNSLKEEIQGLLKRQSEEENARIASLVKIYEGMKAKDAARIFDTLDMEVLLSVIGSMSERKSAPIIAAMSPDRARNVTIRLAEQKKLSNLDDGGQHSQ